MFDQRADAREQFLEADRLQHHMQAARFTRADEALLIWERAARHHQDRAIMQLRILTERIDEEKASGSDVERIDDQEFRLEAVQCLRDLRDATTEGYRRDRSIHQPQLRR